MGVLPHIIWAPSSLSSCCLLPQSPLCVLRPIRLSPMPPATTFPTPTGLPSPTPQPRLLAPWLRPPCLQLRSLCLCRSLRLLRAWPPLRLLRQEEEGGDR